MVGCTSNNFKPLTAGEVMQRKQKFEYGDVVLWKSPSSDDQAKVTVVSCRADDPLEPFYRVQVNSTKLLTHAFESSLSLIEEEGDD